jgi:hypothetical protein
VVVIAISKREVFATNFHKSPAIAAFFNMPQNGIEGRFENFYAVFIEIFLKCFYILYLIIESTNYETHDFYLCIFAF